MHVFLSPHMDDTTLSCGGTIHQLTQSGESVHIITIMAGYPPHPLPASPLVAELHARWQAGISPITVRREEETQANAILGATVTFWDIPDCIYRTLNNTPLYVNGDDDLFGGVHPQDPAHQQLDHYTLPADATAVYIPAGIGNHVDHVLVKQWALDQLTNADCFLYADYPYSSSQSAVESLPSVIKTFDVSHFNAKVQAVNAYRSQISTFWEDANHMRQQLEADMRDPHTGRFAEHYWRIV
jgi:LmbE family N-acetylglucosaminyl deacetylase